MFRAYCTFLAQSKSPPPAIHCIHQGTHIIAGSATILFRRAWPTAVTWRFGKDQGKQSCKGKREGGRRKDRYERTVVYSKDNAAMKSPCSPRHSSRGTLWCWPNVPTCERSVMLQAIVARYPAIRFKLWLVPPNQPPEWETHGPPTNTSNSQRLLAKNWHGLHNWPADLRKWPRLHCNVCRPHDKKSTWASLQENNRCPGSRVHIHRRHGPPTWSAPRGCIGPRCTFHSRLFERSWEDSADKAAHVYGIPSRNGWSLWKLKQHGCTLIVWLRNSRSSQFGWLPAIRRVC